MRSSRPMVVVSFVLVSGCAAIFNVGSGRNDVGLMDVTLTQPVFAPGDPLKICADKPGTCPTAPSMSCRIDNVGPGDFGGPLSCVAPVRTMVKPDLTYDIKMEVQCYEPVVQRATLDKPWIGRFEFKTAPPARRFVKEALPLGRFPTGVHSGLGRSGEWLDMPALAEVEVLRDWPRGDGCPDVVARVVDAAGVIEAGTLVFVEKKVLIDALPANETVATRLAGAKAERERQTAALAEARKKAAEVALKTSEQETKSGQCTSEHTALMQRVLSNFKRLMETNRFTLASNHVVVAGVSPLRLRTTLSGEYHIIGLGFDDAMKLEVRDSSGQVASLKSAYAGISRSVTDLTLDSAVFEGNAISNFSVSLKGKGCALVTVFYKYGE
jgi:hypothetical protein